MSSDQFINVKDMPLNEWLNLVSNPPKDKVFLKRAFPTNKHKDEYLKTIHLRADDDVYKLLHSFLMHSTSIELIDEINFESLIDASKTDRERFEKMISHGYYKRLIQYFRVSNRTYPWEGNTWILDLLPHSPKTALEALNAYIFAHIPVLPDMALHGLFDAAEIIRAKYVGLPGTQNDKVAFLQELSTRHFEHLVERLYHAMEYETVLTAPSSDGGVDVIAEIREGAKSEFVLIECKRYTGSVGVEIVRRLLGVVHHRKANRGILVTSGQYTKGARKFASSNSVHLINGEELVMLLNEHLGANWAQKLDRIVADSEKHYKEQANKILVNLRTDED